MADRAKMQFKVNDGPWRDVEEGVSHTVQIPMSASAIKIDHRLKPIRTDAEIVARLRSMWTDRFDRDELKAIIKGDF